MVALAKEWHKKLGVCEDIRSCGCCGAQDFQQVKEVEVCKLELLKWTQNKIHGTGDFLLSTASMPGFMNKTQSYIGCTMILCLMVYCKCVIHTIGVCSMQRKVKSHQMPLLMASSLASDVTYRS